MASRLPAPAPSGIYARERYNRVGPNYERYGEQPGFYYDSYTDTYHVNPKDRQKELENLGVIDPVEPPKGPPGLGSLLLPIAGAAGAIGVGKALGPEIVSGFKGALGLGSAGTAGASAANLAAAAPAAGNAFGAATGAGAEFAAGLGGGGFGGGGAGGAALAGETGAATPGLGLTSLAGPAAFLAAAPLYTPLINQGGEKLAQALGIIGKDRDRIYNPKDSLNSRNLPKQIPGWEGMTEDQKLAIIDKAHSSGLLTTPGYTDPATGEAHGEEGDHLRLIHPEQPKHGERMLGINDYSKILKQQREALPDALKRLEGNVQLSDKYRTGLQELASLAAGTQSQSSPFVGAEDVKPVPRPTPGNLGDKVPPNWVSQMPQGTIPTQANPLAEIAAQIAAQQGSGKPLQVVGPRPVVPPGINLRSRTSSPGIASNGQRISYGR